MPVTLLKIILSQLALLQERVFLRMVAGPIVMHGVREHWIYSYNYTNATLHSVPLDEVSVGACM